jgi:hypothetical protein
MQENAWMTEELVLLRLTMLWGGIATTRRRQLLVWDDFTAHKTERVKACVQQTCNTDVVIVPSGCTSILQAPDISWNKPCKEKYMELWNKWSVNGNKTYTAGAICKFPKKMSVFNG